jgi:hypothetical protein
MSPIRTTALLAATALLALATACSSESSPEDDVEQAVRDSTQAINEGDVDTFLELNSQRCREQRSEDETQQMMDLVNEEYGDVELESIEITDVTDDTAQVNATTGIDDLDDDDSEPWVLEDGQWRSDGC